MALTSHDYDAPMDEAGDPTAKFHALREVILRHFPHPNVPVPDPLPKMTLPDVPLAHTLSVLSPGIRHFLGKGTRQNTQPLTFEAMNQASGFLLYETELPASSTRSAPLYVNGLRDSAHVFVNDVCKMWCFIQFVLFTNCYFLYCQ